MPQPGDGKRTRHCSLFLDPFGYSHAPMTLTRDLVQQPKSDTLIFLPLSFVNRFAGREGQERRAGPILRHAAWREVPSGPGAPAAATRVLFRAQLKSAGLELGGRVSGLKPDGKNEYWIVGGSGNLKGLRDDQGGLTGRSTRSTGKGYAAPRALRSGPAEPSDIRDPTPRDSEHRTSTRAPARGASTSDRSRSRRQSTSPNARRFLDHAPQDADPQTGRGRRGPGGPPARQELDSSRRARGSRCNSTESVRTGDEHVFVCDSSGISKRRKANQYAMAQTQHYRVDRGDMEPGDRLQSRSSPGLRALLREDVR